MIDPLFIRLSVPLCPSSPTARAMQTQWIDIISTMSLTSSSSTTSAAPFASLHTNWLSYCFTYLDLVALGRVTSVNHHWSTTQQLHSSWVTRENDWESSRCLRVSTIERLMKPPHIFRTHLKNIYLDVSELFSRVDSESASPLQLIEPLFNNFEQLSSLYVNDPYDALGATDRQLLIDMGIQRLQSFNLSMNFYSNGFEVELLTKLLQPPMDLEPPCQLARLELMTQPIKQTHLQPIFESLATIASKPHVSPAYKWPLQQTLTALNITLHTPSLILPLTHIPLQRLDLEIDQSLAGLDESELDVWRSLHQQHYTLESTKKDVQIHAPWCQSLRTLHLAVYSFVDPVILAVSHLSNLEDLSLIDSFTASARRSPLDEFNPDQHEEEEVEDDDPNWPVWRYEEIARAGGEPLPPPTAAPRNERPSLSDLLVRSSSSGRAQFSLDGARDLVQRDNLAHAFASRISTQGPQLSPIALYELRHLHQLKRFECNFRQWWLLPIVPFLAQPAVMENTTQVRNPAITLDASPTTPLSFWSNFPHLFCFVYHSIFSVPWLRLRSIKQLDLALMHRVVSNLFPTDDDTLDPQDLLLYSLGACDGLRSLHLENANFAPQAMKAFTTRSVLKEIKQQTLNSTIRPILPFKNGSMFTSTPASTIHHLDPLPIFDFCFFRIPTPIDADLVAHEVARFYPTLEYLHFIHCDSLTDTGLGDILDVCTRLHTLDIHGCTQLTAFSLERIGRSIPLLHSLNLSQISAVTDQVMNDILIHTPNLHSLHIKSTETTSARLIPIIQQTIKLLCLNVSENGERWTEEDLNQYKAWLPYPIQLITDFESTGEK